MECIFYECNRWRAIGSMGAFRRGYGGVFNSPDFEVAICITACLLLSRLYFHINSELKKSSNIDKILDDYLYKEMSNEDAYYQLQVNCTGRGGGHRAE